MEKDMVEGDKGRGQRKGGREEEREVGEDIQRY